MTNAGFFLKTIWVIPLLPLFGAAVMFFFGRGSRPAPTGGYDDGHGHDHDGHEPTPTPAGDAHTTEHHADDHGSHGGPAHGAHGEDSRWANPEAPHSFVNAFCVGVIVVAFIWSSLAFLQYTQWAGG